MSEAEPALAEIVIDREEHVPADIIEPFIAELERLGVSIEAHTSERRIYNGMEYYLPTALVVFITARFVGSFLSEAGKDVYHSFKRAVAALFRKVGPIKARVISSGQFKIDRESSYSRVLSIYYRDAKGRRFKFLVPFGLEEADYDAAAEALLEFLRCNQAAKTTDARTSQSRSWQLELLKFNQKQKQWHTMSLGDDREAETAAKPNEDPSD